MIRGNRRFTLMKGMSLPINMIVIVAIAVLVLVVVIGFFSGAIGRDFNTIQFEQSFNNACNQLRNLYNCDPSSVGNVYVEYQASGEQQTNPTRMTILCKQKLGRDSNEDCAVTCGCPRVRPISR